MMSNRRLLPPDPMDSLEEWQRARIDDKLARHKCAPGALGENEIDDLIGYLVLLNIATRMEAQNV